MDALFTAIGDSFGHVLDWMGTFLTSITGAEGKLNALLPIIAIGLSVSILMLGVKIVKSFAWGW